MNLSFYRNLECVKVRERRVKRSRDVFVGLSMLSGCFWASGTKWNVNGKIRRMKYMRQSKGNQDKEKLVLGTYWRFSLASWRWKMLARWQ